MTAAGAVAPKGKYVPPGQRKANEGKLISSGGAPATSAAPSANGVESAATTTGGTGLTDRDKERIKIQKKLKQIDKIKEKQAAGEKVLGNQLPLLAKEADLRAALQQLRL